MQKTPDEIKKALEDGVPYHVHKGEAYLGYIALSETQHKMSDALAYIQQLESANTELLTKVEQLETKCHQLERERDAAVADIHKTCATCKHYYYNRQDDDTADCLWWDGCKNEDHYEWRGVKEE